MVPCVNWIWKVRRATSGYSDCNKSYRRLRIRLTSPMVWRDAHLLRLKRLSMKLSALGLSTVKCMRNLNIYGQVLKYN